ncbi:MAG: hypothetical protein ACRDJC_15540 [Thermomicrobiales bacterium]
MTTSTLIAQVPMSSGTRSADTTLARARVAAAASFLLGVFLAYLGFSWDVQWHTDVGPDTFFTAPHLVLYGGVAIAGLTSLAMVLLTTWYSRRGVAAVLDSTAPILGGYFRGPLGSIIGGFGALFFLLFGLMDQWWHTLYGFDVTLVSPPHVGLILSILVTMAGCLTALAWHVRTASEEVPQRVLAAAGTAFAAAVLVAFITPTLTDLLPWALFGIVSWPNTVVSTLYPAAILLVASVIRRPWAGTLFGLFFTAIDLVVTAVIPGITRDYAASIGLFMRDTSTGEVIVTGLLPTYVLIAGIIVDLFITAGRNWGKPVAIVVPLAGAVAALALRLLEPNLPLYQPSPLDPAELAALREEISSAVATSSLILAPIIGAAAGWFGWLLGIVLKGGSAAPAPRVAQPAVVAAAALTLLLLTPTTTLAHAADPHHETIQAGPYEVLVGFSEWPMRAERSLDITFEPEGGIAGKSATIEITDPNGDWYEVGPLGRHPRQRELWGLDLIAMPTPGDWTIELTVTGPEGTGTGTLTGIPVGERPGPPPAPMWIIAALPLVFLLWLGVRGWFQVRPGRTAEAHAWSP